MPSEQLALPGIKFSRAQRDMSEAAFRRALERNGFRIVGDAGTYFADATGVSRTLWGAILATNPRRINKRATLAKILRERRHEAARTTSEPRVRITPRKSESP